MISQSASAVDLNIDAGTLYVDATNNRVGVGGKTDPATPLHVTGTVTATLFAGSGASLTSIPNGALTNSSITINSSATSLGGSITLTTANIAENTNLYYTNARADARIAAADTNDLSEGSSNLYYTDARVNARVAGGSLGNITTTGYIRGPATFTIDPATHGDNTGTVVIAGNLQVDGTQTTINSTTLTVDDKNITLASGSANASAASGAGFTVDIGSGTNPSITYDGTNDEWDFNKPLNVTGNIAVSGTVDGIDIAARDGVLTSTTTTAGAALPKAGGTLSGNLLMGDNDITGINKLSILDSADNNRLEIYGNASNGFIFDMGGTGSTGTINFNDFNVGIGTTPATNVRLDIRSNAAATLGDFRNASATGFGLYVAAGDTSSQYAFRAADYQNNALFSIMGDGKVGIGVTDPGYLLTVKKDVDAFAVKIENDGNSAGTSGASYADASDGLWVDTRWNTATNTPFKVTSNSGTAPMMIIKGNGNVGIGDTSPDNKLDVNFSITGEGSQEGGIKIQNAHGVANDIAPLYFGVHGGTRRTKAAIGLKREGDYGIGSLIFALDSNGDDANVTFANDEKMRITSAGNAHLSGQIDARIQLSSSGGANIVSDNAVYVRGNDDTVILNSAANGDIKLSENGTARLFIKRSTGNVGIGTSAPDSKLEVVTNSTGIDYTLRLKNTNTTDDNGTAILFQGKDTSGNDVSYGALKFKYTNHVTEKSQFELWHMNNSGTPTQALTLDHDGMFGIGTTNPGAPLDIGSASPKIRLTDTGGGYSELRGNGGVMTLTADAGNNVANSAVTFETDGTERMRISSAGDVMVGTTTNLNVLSGSPKIQVGKGDGHSSMQFYSGNSNVGALYFGDGTSGAGAVGTNGRYPGYIEYRHSNDEMAFRAGATSALSLNATRLKSYHRIEVGTFPQSQTNAGEAWIGRAADRQDGTLTVQLGGNAATGTSFEIVDRAWSKVLYHFSGEAPADSLWTGSNGNTQFGYHAYNSTSGISMIGPTGRTFWDTNYNSTGAEILLVNNRTANGAVSLLQYRTNSVVEGSIYGTSTGLAISNVSDYRKKENIRDLTGSLNVIKSLQPRLYEYREGFGTAGDHVGFIAHEIQDHIPKAVSGNKDDLYTQTDIDEGATEITIGSPKYQAVAYTHNEIITRLVQSIQEQQTLIESLTARISTLEG